MNMVNYNSNHGTRVITVEKKLDCDYYNLLTNHLTFTLIL